ncbi:MAG TPA: outer membrane beta-barrel protein [Chryseolinea sp.]
MKAILLCAALTTMLFQHGYAQLKRGSFVTGATVYPLVRHSNDGSAEVKSYQVAVVPGVSYFVKDRLAVGLVAPWTYVHHKHPDHSMSIETYAFGPTVRYYFPFGHWAIFPMVSHTYGWQMRKSIDTFHATSTVRGNIRTFAVGAGITYFITQHVGVEGVIGFGKNKMTWKDGDIPYDKSDIMLNIGVQVYLFKK